MGSVRLPSGRVQLGTSTIRSLGSDTAVAPAARPTSTAAGSPPTTHPRLRRRTSPRPLAEAPTPGPRPASAPLRPEGAPAVSVTSDPPLMAYESVVRAAPTTMARVGGG